MRHTSRSQINTIFLSDPRHDRHRTLLFVIDGAGTPDRLRYAIERELPWITILECESVSDIQPSYRDTLALVVVAPRHIADIERQASDVLRFHPLATVAVMTGCSSMDPETVCQLQSSKVIRGVLPMHAKLDVLTPIVALMMHGGDYYPRSLVQAQVPHPQAYELKRQQLAVPMGPRSESPSFRAVARRLSFLTKREHQILSLVARGLQNKSIASDLDLSEHTVKIHLHNIITKLGTHNRTEAAAVYRDGGGMVSTDPQVAGAGFS